jgi:hypothetical protein
MSKSPLPMSVLIGRGIVREMFKGQALVMVPNCGWTGHECDVLVVTRDLRVVDVEVKQSYADLVRDVNKTKWWARQQGARAPLDHPPRVWKHWYAISEQAWRDGAFTSLPSASGVVIWRDGTGQVSQRWSKAGLLVIRKPKPSKDAKPLSAVEVMDIARLASLRLWDEYTRQGKEPTFGRPRNVISKATP